MHPVSESWGEIPIFAGLLWMFLNLLHRTFVLKGMPWALRIGSREEEKMLSAGKFFGKVGLYRRALTKEQPNNKQQTEEQ